MELKDNEILDNLYKKHRDLNAEKARITADQKKIEAAIVAFGGSVPVYFTAIAETLEAYVPYPKHGTWKDKILYALDGKSANIDEIAAILKKQEKDYTIEQLTITVSQYCSAMAIKEELDRTKDGRKYIYSLKK